MTEEDSYRLSALEWAIDEASRWEGMLLSEEEIKAWKADIEKAREGLEILKNFLEST